MTTLSWQDQFNINVAQIDEQHRQMLTLAIELHDAVSNGHSPDALVHRLDALTEFTRMHFSFEESMMEKHAYPGLEAHKQEHANLLQHLNLFRQGVASGRLLQLSPSVDIAEDWVLAHVAGSDRELGEFLNHKKVF